MDRKLVTANLTRLFLVLTLMAAVLIGCAHTVHAQTSGPRRYERTWESLAKHTDPEWFRDAKFGIYTHWGSVTFGAEDGPSGVQWYGRNMYFPDSPTFKYHRKRFGDQNKVGYKDIVPLFNPKKFHAETWADLFAAAGAKFAGPVVIHHDNYAMWDSAFTKWDSMDQSPKRDFTAELEKAIRKRNMKFITTFHHAFAWRYYEPAFVFKMTGFDIFLQDSVRFEQPEAVRLGPDKATLEGKKIHTQTNEDRLNIGFWDNPNERAHWLVNIPESGDYMVRGEFSSAYGTSGLKVSAAEQSCSAEVPKTNGWFKPKFVSFGTFTFANPGVYHLVLEPSDPACWRTVNVYQLQLAQK